MRLKNHTELSTKVKNASLKWTIIKYEHFAHIFNPGELSWKISGSKCYHLGYWQYDFEVILFWTLVWHTFQRWLLSQHQVSIHEMTGLYIYLLGESSLTNDFYFQIYLRYDIIHSSQKDFTKICGTLDVKYRYRCRCLTKGTKWLQYRYYISMNNFRRN